MPGGRRVFRLESVLEAGVNELYDILFLRVEEMHKWNPSIQQIKVSCPGHRRRLRTTQTLTLTALGLGFVSAAGFETRWIRNHRHPRGFGPGCRQSDRPEGLCLCQTQPQTQVSCLSQRSGHSAGVLAASGRLCEVQTTRHSAYFHGTL